jgi:hypothetical protein
VRPARPSPGPEIAVGGSIVVNGACGSASAFKAVRHSTRATKGVSYTDFVIRACITLAKQLLLTTDAAISDIAWPAA